MCGKSESGWELIGSLGVGGHWVNIFAYPYNWKRDKNRKCWLRLILLYYCIVLFVRDERYHVIMM